MALTRPLTRRFTRDLTRGLVGLPGSTLNLIFPDGPYPGADIIISGGQGPYTLIINGVDSGTITDTLPADLEPGDTVQVRDALGRLSRVVVIQGGWNDDGDFWTDDGEAWTDN